MTSTTQITWFSRFHLRNPADYRSLLWLACATAVAAVSWHYPDLRIYLWPLGAYFSLACGLIAHGHNHCPIFSSRALNQIVNLVTTAFFGFPTFVWIAGHNELHHKYTNGPRDPSAGWRLSKRHNLFTAIACPVYAMLCESLIVPFLATAWKRNPRRFRACLLQIICYLGGVIVGIIIDWKAFLWAFTIPWLFGLYLIHYFNYIQHIHCSPYSEFAHSRDWTGRLLNFLLFNQGFHTVHHNQPGVHWSRWPEMHEKVKDRIPAELQSNNLALWIVQKYFLSLLCPRFGTRQIGIPPWEVSNKQIITLHMHPASGDSL